MIRLDRTLFVARATAIAVALCVCGPVLAADQPSPADEPSPAADAATATSEPKSGKAFSEEDVQLLYQIALHGRRDLSLAPEEASEPQRQVVRGSGGAGERFEGGGGSIVGARINTRGG